MSTSLFTVSSVIVAFELPAFTFLNSKFTPAFCLNTPTPAIPTLLAVLVSPPPPPPTEAQV